MDGLIKSSDSKYDEYESLLLERDQVQKEAGQIWTAYLQQFGKAITDVYEEKLKCVKCKKTIAFYQSALNRGGDVDPNAMTEYLEKEMAEYYSNLDRMIRENEEANNSGTSSPYEVQRSKELYRRLAKLVHPDINPETDRNDEMMELWQRITIAYHQNSVKELSELEVLVRKVLKETGAENIKAEIPDIEEKIEELLREIERIKKDEPYSLRYLVEDEAAAKKKKDEFQKELDEFRRYRKELEEVTLRMLGSGGLKIHVQ